MILVEPGATGNQNLEAALEFARLLRAEGYAACVSSAAIQDPLLRLLKYEAITDIRDPDDIVPDHVIVLNADKISGSALIRLRDLFSTRKPNLSAIGLFESSQSQIGAKSKIAYSTGQEPALVDLHSLRDKPLIENSSHLLFGLQDNSDVHKQRPEYITLFLPDEFVENESTFELLNLLAHSAEMQLTIIVSAAKRTRVQREMGQHVLVYSYAEMQPEILAKRSDVMVFLGEGSPGGRAASSAVHLMVNGGVVIDSTEQASLANSGAPIVRGPTKISGVVALVKENVWPQFAQLSAAILESDWIQQNLSCVLTNALDLKRPGPTIRENSEKKDRQKTIIMPTNGVGLGHAQRGSLIARELPPGNTVQFAAFPGCVPMLRAKGFEVVPLVSKSPAHTEPYANDLMNYLRLRGILRCGDRIVFDGAYIFDSVVRNIREFDLDATWVRRGLWQPGQIDKMPLEREREFSRVIVPGEAFDELNSPYTFGSHVQSVGPIVQIDPITQEVRTQVREKILERIDRKFKKLLVTMLGGGVAADRSAQIQSLCALTESKDDWLHLMVVWPHATLSPSLETWRNSHVVRTQNALRLAQASDLTIAAAGYNSFHELLYHCIPTVFIPQMAGYMDDQERRARAASDRGLAVTVQPGDLFTLRREVSRLLDSERSLDLVHSMEALSLPEIGNEAAAQVVERAHET